MGLVIPKQLATCAVRALNKGLMAIAQFNFIWGTNIMPNGARALFRTDCQVTATESLVWNLQVGSGQGGEIFGRHRDH